MKPTTIRLDEDKLKKLKDLKIDLATLVREVIDVALQYKRCPTCGQNLTKSHCETK